MTTLPDDEAGAAAPTSATKRANALAAAVALAGGFAAVALSWTWAGALAGFALFLVWNGRRETVERAVDAEATLYWYVGASRELIALGTRERQPALQRVAQRHGRDWIAGTLRPGAAERGGVALVVDGIVVATLAPVSVSRYRARHGDAPTAVAFALVERGGELAIAFV